ncbi:MAG: heme-binding protein [Chthoniobacter sp.]|nr:heme-binding protein [Chthoniobacter sp.]
MKRPKTSVLIFIVLPIAAAIFWLAGNSRAATETPEYRVVRTDGKCEIRDYPALTVATTPMTDAEMNRSFGQLFRYITGGNAGAEKIAMTAPVLIDTVKDGRTMSFILPKATVEKGVPKPSGEDVTVGQRAASRFAVLRFEGGRTTANEKAAVEKLQAWLVEQKLTAKGEPLFAYYDPPWTPVFLRRNEVLLRLAQE